MWNMVSLVWEGLYSVWSWFLIIMIIITTLIKNNNTSSKASFTQPPQGKKDDSYTQIFQVLKGFFLSKYQNPLNNVNTFDTPLKHHIHYCLGDRNMPNVILTHCDSLYVRLRQWTISPAASVTTEEWIVLFTPCWHQIVCFQTIFLFPCWQDMSWGPPPFLTCFLPLTADTSASPPPALPSGDIQYSQQLKN